MSNRLASAHASERVPAPQLAYRSEREVMAEVQAMRAQALREFIANWRARRAERSATAETVLPSVEEAYVLRRANELRGERLAEIMVAVGRWIAQRVEGWRQSMAEASAMRELAGLDDRMLADIGISRSDIPALARHGRDDVMPSAGPVRSVSERMAA